MFLVAMSCPAIMAVMMTVAHAVLLEMLIPLEHPMIVTFMAQYLLFIRVYKLHFQLGHLLYWHMFTSNILVYVLATSLCTSFNILVLCSNPCLPV